jgi:plasmid stability protein
MSTLTIRNLEPHIKDKLRQTAAAHGRSMEEEVRSILRHVLTQPTTVPGLGSRVHARFAALGGAEDVQLPPRTELPRAAHLGDAGASA